MSTSAIDLIIRNKEEDTIWNQVQENIRLTDDQALYLYEKADLGFTAALADWKRKQKHGNKTFFNKNIHIEPTNVCIYTCKFCSYSRLIKERSEGWEYTKDDMMRILAEQEGKGITEVHIVGGVLPQYDLKFYIDLFNPLKHYIRIFISNHSRR
jgi:aminodeoxyfutalosine synthase